MSWLGDQFENKHLFRRIAYYSTYYLVWNLTIWSTDLAYHLSSLGMGGLEIAAVIGSISAPPTALTAFMTKLYSESRRQSVNT